MGGQPFKDGEEPEYRQNVGDDDVFASVVLDEDFVRSAEVHEPSAVERILAASQSRAETEAPRGPDDTGERDGYGDDLGEDEGRFDRSDYGGYTGLDSPYGHSAQGWNPAFDVEHEHGSDYGYARRAHRPGAAGPPARRRARRPYEGPHGAAPDGTGPYRGHARWQRPIAWVLAVVMGIGLVALALSAVHRSDGKREAPAPPPATSAVESRTPEVGEREGDLGAVPPVPAETGAPRAAVGG